MQEIILLQVLPSLQTWLLKGKVLWLQAKLAATWHILSPLGLGMIAGWLVVALVLEGAIVKKLRAIQQQIQSQG